MLFFLVHYDLSEHPPQSEQLSPFGGGSLLSKSAYIKGQIYQKARFVAALEDLINKLKE